MLLHHINLRASDLLDSTPYLCPFSDCWVAALKRKAIERALEVTLGEAEVAKLTEFASQLPERGENES